MRFYLLIGDWAMQGSWWRCPRRWWATIRLTVAMLAVNMAIRGADSSQARILDVGDNIVAVGSGASLITIMGIVFHAGQLANRIKSLESRMGSAEDKSGLITKHAEELAGLVATVAAMESNIEQINQGIHDIRSYIMTLSTRNH